MNYYFHENQFHRFKCTRMHAYTICFVINNVSAWIVYVIIDYVTSHSEA